MPTTTQTTTVKVPKSMGLAYVLWFFLGELGVHRFYLGRKGSAIVQLLLGIVGWLLAIVGVGFVLLAVLWIWLVVDIFLIPGMARTAGSITVQATTVTTSDENTNEPV